MYISMKKMVTGKLSELFGVSKNKKTCGFPQMVTEYRKVAG
jgi:hypothetical protein